MIAGAALIGEVAPAPDPSTRSVGSARRSLQVWALLWAASTVATGCRFDLPDRDDHAGNDGSIGDDGLTADASLVRCAMTYGYSYNGHKYRLIESGSTWAQARASCEVDGGYLLKIETSAEDTNIAEAFAFGPEEVWIGLSDPSNDGGYAWTDGTALTFTNWSAPPSAGSPDCVAKNTYTTDGKWYTRNCTDSRAVMCECSP